MLSVSLWRPLGVTKDLRKLTTGVRQRHNLVACPVDVYALDAVLKVNLAKEAGRFRFHNR